jgi:hypothetical protein
MVPATAWIVHPQQSVLEDGTQPLCRALKLHVACFELVEALPRRVPFVFFARFLLATPSH